MVFSVVVFFEDDISTIVFSTDAEKNKIKGNKTGTGQLPPRIIAPRTIAPRIIAPQDNCPLKIAIPEIGPQIISPWTIGAQSIAKQNN